MRFLLVIYDNASYIHDFPLGMAYIASVLRNEGVDVEIYSQDMNHWPDEHLTEYLNKNKFDFIGLSIVGGYYQYRKLLSLSKAINASKNKPIYIIGGHGPSPEPEYFLLKSRADICVIGEGEITIANIVRAKANKTPLSEVKGIAYREGNKVFVNERQPLIKDIDTIPWPAYDMFPMDYYRLQPMPKSTKLDFIGNVLSARGCHFKCNFCYRLDAGFRARRGECIVEEVKMLKKEYGITYIVFNDELLMSNVQRTIELCEVFIKKKMNVKWWCSGRLNAATPEVMRLMKEAGCVFVNYGIEAMDDDILRTMKKCLSTKTIYAGIQNTLDAGISPGYNMLFGNIGENRETLNKAVEFLLEYDDGSQLRTIRPVTPYPGSPLYYEAIKRGLLKDVEDFYTNKHLNSDLLAVNFTELTDDEFHEALYDANERLLTNYYNNQKETAIKDCEELYVNKNATFRGFRQM